MQEKLSILLSTVLIFVSLVSLNNFVKRTFLLLFSFTITVNCFAQNVGIGTATPNEKAILDVYSTTKGVLLPSLTTTQRDSIQNPPNGLHIYNIDDNCLNYFDSSLNAWNCYCENCRIKKDTTIPINVNSWDAFSFDSLKLVASSSTTYFNTAEGIKFIGQNYRYGIRLQTKEEFRFKNKTIYFKWKGIGGGQFAAFVVQIKYDPLSNDGTPAIQGIDLPIMTVGNSYNGSYVIQEDTWYYTRIRSIKGTDNYEITTATDNYGNSGGNIVQTLTIPIYTKSGYLAIRLGDNYAGSNAYGILGECRIANN